MDMQVERDTSSSADIRRQITSIDAQIDLVLKLQLEISQIRIVNNTLHDGLKEVNVMVGKLHGAWKHGMITEAESKSARIDTLEQRNSDLEKQVRNQKLQIGYASTDIRDLEKQVTALQLQIENGSADIATPQTTKRWRVALSLPRVPMSFAWDEPEMKQRLSAASSYMFDYPIGVMKPSWTINLILGIYLGIPST